MDNLQNKSLWLLMYDVDETDPNICRELDPHLADKLKTEYDLHTASYHLGCNYTEFLPLTKSKVNAIIKERIELWKEECKKDNDEMCLPKFTFSLARYARWLDKDIVELLINVWVAKDNHYDSYSWLSEIVDGDGDLCQPVIQKLIRLYVLSKSRRNLKRIEDFFVRIGKTHLDKVCEKIDESTPTVKACLLNRDDINEKYVISGLKAIAKLTTQKKVKTKININSLKNLGPRSRLDAMKHLLGLLYWYYDSRKDTHQLPFTTVPTREEISEFLFPCSIKYNDEVTKLMGRYDELINKKEENHV